jgi:hypothetical protein
MLRLSDQSLTCELNLASKIGNLLLMLQLNRSHFNLQILNSGSQFRVLNLEVLPNIIVILD